MQSAFRSILAAAALAPFWNQPAQPIAHIHSGLVFGINSIKGCNIKLGGATIAVAGMKTTATSWQ